MNSRHTMLLDAGARLAAEHGPSNVTRRMVAQACEVSEALVSNYMGSVEDAQSAYKKHARKLGLKLPDAATEARKGRELRAHGPRDKRRQRPRSQRERVAIVKKTTAARSPKLPPLVATE